MKPIPGSEIVGSAELRKHESENVTGENFSHTFFFHVFPHFLRAWNRLLKLLAIICTLLVPNFAGLLRTSHLPIEIAKIETLKILSGQNREIKHLLGTLFLKN